jgi:hypothetical protein
MKLFMFGLAGLLCSVTTLAQNNVNIRCEGVNSKLIRVGLDVELDAVDRLVSLTSWEAEATHVIDIKSELGAPSHFFKADRKGNLLVFGFKSFNDGLEENMSVLFVKGNKSLTTLMLKDASGLSFLAKGEIHCRILK